LSNRFAETESDIKFQAALQQLKSTKDGASVELPIDKISTNDNIRSSVKKDDPEFMQLVESIKESGLLQLPVVTVTRSEILCISGHRRIEALKYLGIDKVKCVIRHIEEQVARKVAQLAENTARKALAPLDLALAVNGIKSDGGYSSVRLAELLGKERKYVERLLKISNWCEEAKKIVRENEEKFNLHGLFYIAQRKLSDDEVLHELSKGLVDTNIKPLPVKVRREEKRNELYSWCEAKGYGVKETELIKEFLKEKNVKGWSSLL